MITDIQTDKLFLDEKAIKIFEQIFKGQTLVTINANEIANEGGILNNIIWNTRMDNKA